MRRENVLSERHRDAGLARLRWANRGLTGAATALLLAFVAVAVRGFSGHSSTATAKTASNPPSSASQTAHRHHRSEKRRLDPPRTAPKPAAEHRHVAHHARTHKTHAASHTPTTAAPSPAPTTTVSGGS